MGCTPSHPPVIPTPPVNPNRESHHRHLESDSDDSITPEDVSQQRIDELLKLMQKHNLKRMTEEIKTDVHLFVLNNLLMSVQFFDNFERSTEAARQFKREKESEITNILAQEPQDGQIMGDRKCYLIHGMGHILAKNYIYRPSDHFVEDDLYASVQNRFDPVRSTFMCEGILPLEFTMSWDNLEVHDDSQWDSLNSAPYESASGSPPTIRFCMEGPDEKNKVPNGFVRLRCVDLPISMRPRLSLLHVSDAEHGYLYDYGHFSDDKISEARSDSDGIPESDESDIPANFMDNLKERSYPPLPSTRSKITNPTSESGRKIQSDIFPNDKRRDSGVRHIPKFTRGQLLKVSSEITINVDPSTPKIDEENSNFEYPEEEVLDENANVTKYLNPLSKPSSDRWSKYAALPSQSSPNDRISKTREPNSSGYETGSQTSVASRSSSLVTLASEEVRDRWRSTELKSLSDYVEKNRRKNTDRHYKPEPLSTMCFMNVKYELDSEEENGDDSDSESEDSDVPAEPVKTETRTYLNSSQFSADYCSEFHYIAPRHGLPIGVVENAVVLGTTVRCAVPCKSDRHHNSNEDSDDDGSEDFNMLYQFTPSLTSKSWPKKLFFKFNMRMKNKKHHEERQWPSFHQVDAIDDTGCNMIPLGFRSIEFFNTQQCLEWKVNFAKSETLLLNTFKHVHWRTYIFCSLIYRAFLAPLGPQGIGLEHFRNIIYFMCHEDFVSWNDEQPGLHVKALLEKLYECLGRCRMPSFFIGDHNLLKSIPPQNTRLVQAHLSKVRENLLVHFIYAFRNLTSIRETGKYYPMPKFDKLYKMLIGTKKQHLLQIITPGLLGSEENDEAQKKEIRKKNKKKNKKIQLDLIANQDKYEGEFRSTFVIKSQQNDKTRDKYRKKRKIYEDKERQRRKQEKSADVIPETERRKSIDLESMPAVPEQFDSFRLSMIIQFFIEHFLQMARQANEFRAYPQATMYVLQIENLCQILRDKKISSDSVVDEELIVDYEKKATHLRSVIGGETRTYVTSRFPHLDSHNANYPFLGEYYGKSMSIYSSNADNWKLGKLPTPPESVQDEVDAERKDSQPVKIFEAPKLAKSLQSIPSVSRKVTRTESIKFIDKPIIIRPKSYSRSNSQEPATLNNGYDEESTDL